MTGPAGGIASAALASTNELVDELTVLDQRH